MAQTQITDLPQALPLTGFESVPIVQNGVTVQTTTGSIAVQPTQTQTFITATQQPSLTNSRYLVAGSGLSILDNGAGSYFQFNLTGAALSLDSSGTGIQVKTNLNTLTPRQITTGTGLSVSNGDGVAANPQINLGTFLSNFQSMSGSTGILGVSGGSFNALSIAGTSGNIIVTNGDGSTGSPTINLATTAVTAGTYGSSSLIPVITVDSYGRVTAISTSSSPAGTVTSVTGVSPILSSGGTTPAISLVSSYGDIQNPYASKTANFFLAAPNGSSGVPTFRAINVADVPTLNQNTTGTASNVTGIVAAANGGTGTGTLATNGQLLIGNGSGYTLSTLTAGSNITITNSAGGITIASTAGSGVTTFSAGTTGFTPSTATTGTITLAGTLNVANGGTGVTASTGANSVVLRDANANITTNCLFEGYSSQAASGTTIVLTAASVQNWQITGSGGQVIRLPNATTLPNGATFTFNNNQSSGAITVQNNSSTTISTIQSGGYVTIVLLDNSTAAGSWDKHDSTPSNVSWSTNTFDYPGSITSATWNGVAVAVNRGGTGATTAAGARTNLGLGTIATQDANNVAIIGGAIDGTVIGGTTPAAATFTTLTANSTSQFGKGLANYVQITGNTTGNGPFISALGSDANVGLIFQNKGQASFEFRNDPALGVFGIELASNTTVDKTIYIDFHSSAGTDYDLRLSRNPGVNGNAVYQNAGTGAHIFYTTSTANQFTVAHTASAVNYIQATGSATGAGVTFSSQGSDATVNINYWAKGSGAHILATGASYTQQATVLHTASAVNQLTLTGAIAGAGPILASFGSDTNIDMNLTTKGTGTLIANLNGGYFKAYRDSGTNTVQVRSNGNLGLYSEAGGGISFNTNTAGDVKQMQVSHTASAVNYVQVTGAATGNNPIISAQGSDTNAGMLYYSKGYGSHQFRGYNGANIFLNVIAAQASPVNYVQIGASSSGNPLVIQAAGSDTNIPLVLQPAGTGALQAQQTDSTATGGNARGANAVDWQTARGAASQVASGSNSVLVGGQNNTSSSYTSFLGGGANNYSQASNSFVGAGNSNLVNLAGNYAAIVAGNGNTVQGYANFIGAGSSNSGTSGSAVTTQSGTMNGTTAVTLSGSNASIKVGQYISGTSIGSETYVAAISGTSLTLSKNASGSSTNTLTFYTPHGVVVGGGNNQATGSYSFIGGGGDAGTAGNRNVASGDWSVVGGGFKNVASGIQSFIGGGTNNIANQQLSMVLAGDNNTAGAYSASVLGGRYNTSNATYSTTVGGFFGTTRGIQGNTVFAACNAPLGFTAGYSQGALLILAIQTTTATATVITSDGSAASGTNQVILPNNSAYYFRGEIIAGVTGAGNTKGWYIEGVIKRGAGVGTTVLVGSTVSSLYGDAGAVTWTIGLTADTTNGGLAVTATGQASTTIRWVAQIRTTEMTY